MQDSDTNRISINHSNYTKIHNITQIVNNQIGI